MPSLVFVTAGQAGRRLDNFLLAHLKPIPKSRVYQMIRRGEVRIDGGRARPEQRLEAGAAIRIPPLFAQPDAPSSAPPQRLVEMIKTCILHEDERLLVINKPAGLVVHAGTGRAFGVIDLLQCLYSGEQELRLAHRLDKETSGCLLAAKNMETLRRTNLALRMGAAGKEYQALLRGRLPRQRLKVEAALRRRGTPGGDGRVSADAGGKPAMSVFETLKTYRNATLVAVRIATGRTHQIRVHAASIGHPVAGDDKYGDREFNREMREVAGLRRMFLHADRLSVPELASGGAHQFTAPLPAELEAALERLAQPPAGA